MKNNETIFIIDDDSELCQALRWLFESVYLNVETYCNANDFLKSYDRNKRGCLIVDVRMPVMSGLQLLEKLEIKKNILPVIVMTAHGDISMAVRAMKAGAVDFILKPINDQNLLEIIQKSLLETEKFSITNNEVDERIKELTKRELQVMHFILEGKLNKEIAYELKISISTVEAHRARVMRKMQAKTLAELIKSNLQHSVNKF
jgi:two-component system response regulator FixJ